MHAEPPPGPVPDADDTLQLLLPVRAPVAVAGVGGRADAARGRRPDHAADRGGLPRPRGDDGAADQPRQAHRRRAPLDQPGDLATVLRVLYLVFNEGYARRRRPRGRGDPAHPPARRADRRAGGRRAARADAAAPRPARRADRAGRPPRAAGRAGPRRVGHRADRRGRRPSCRPRSPATGWASTRRRPRSPRCTPTRRARRRPTGCRSSSGTTSCSALTDSPVVRLNRAVAVGEADGPAAGLAALADLDPTCPATPRSPRTCTSARATSTRAAPLYAEAARTAASAAERDHLIRQAARLRQFGAASRRSSSDSSG